MSNKPSPKHSDAKPTQVSDTQPASVNAATQPSFKAWGNKLIVVLLCALSFFAGWKAQQSSFIDACLDSGGQMVERHGVHSCEW